MASPDPSFTNSAPASGPRSPLGWTSREPMRGSAITGGIMTLATSAIIFMSTLTEWAAIPSGMWGGVSRYNLWELGVELGSFSFHLFGMTLFVTMVIAIVFLCLNTTGQRRVAGGWLLALMIFQFMMVMTVLLVYDEHTRMRVGVAAMLAVPATLVGLVGAIVALVGSRISSVEPIAPRPRPMPRQAAPERSLTAALEELTALRDKGFLSEEEYERKRKQILGLD